MYPAPTRCPVCRSELNVSRLHCSSCDTSIEGRFTGGPFAHLTAEHLDFIVTFVRCEGKINRMEQELDLSYPTRQGGSCRSQCGEAKFCVGRIGSRQTLS